MLHELIHGLGFTGGVYLCLSGDAVNYAVPGGSSHPGRDMRHLYDQHLFYRNGTLVDLLAFLFAHSVVGLTIAPDIDLGHRAV